MKKLTKLLLACAVSAMVAGPVNAAGLRNLRLAHALPTDHPVHTSLEWFAEQVEARTKLRIKVVPNGTLGDENSLLQMVQSGSLAFTKVSAAPLSTVSKVYNILSLPYLFTDRAQYDKVLEGKIGKEILASSRSAGFIGLAFLDAGARSFYTSKPIREPADLKGMKIRVQSSPISIDTMKALGATAVPLPYGELYSALQQGVVDGAENNIPSYFSSRHYEVKPVYSYDEHTMVPDVLVVSTEVWDKLTDEQRAIVSKVADETVEQQKTNWKNYVDKSVQELDKFKVQFVQSDKAKFQEAVKPVYEKFKQQNPDLVPMLDEIMNTK